MLVSEIFKSIQGESTFAGLPSVFVRLAGCNLDCDWCDTDYAKALNDGKIKDAKETSVDEVIKEVARLDARIVTITGGEPLLQNETEELITKLLALSLAPKPNTAPRTVLLETNGSIGLAQIDKRVVKIVDVKCPSSGHADSFKIENLQYLNPEDEIKFVIADKADYEFARKFVDDHLTGEWIAGTDDQQNDQGIKFRFTKILFSPVLGTLEPRALAEWVLADHLNVRLQVQLHKMIWHPDERGV
jgi:7-carboxy-7-deazaguanine synthase